MFTESAMPTTAIFKLAILGFFVAVLLRNIEQWTVYLRGKINELKIYDHICCDPLSPNASALDSKLGSIGPCRLVRGWS